MNNRRSMYRTTLVSCMALIAIFICSVAFIGCPEADEMTDEVLTPPSGTPPPADAPSPPEDMPPPPPEDG